MTANPIHASHPDLSTLVTEDDTPVDNLLQEKLIRLLVQCLYSSYQPGVPFLAAADAGLFYSVNLPALVPDVMLSLDVRVSEDWTRKENRSYFVWEMGKPPEVCLEIIPNLKGDELGKKTTNYARAGVAYYATYDPLRLFGNEPLIVRELRGGRYEPLPEPWMEAAQLGLTPWEGSFEGLQYPWLRWCDRAGKLLLTGDEKAERLAQALKAKGLNPEEFL